MLAARIAGENLSVGTSHPPCPQAAEGFRRDRSTKVDFIGLEAERGAGTSVRLKSRKAAVRLRWPKPVLQIRPLRVPVYEPIAPWGFLSLWTGVTRPRWRCSGFCKSCSAARNFLGKLCLSGQNAPLTQMAITASIRLQCELGAWRKPCDRTSNRLSKKARNNAFEMLLEGPLLTR